MEEYLKLGDICRPCGISPETLRRYERAGLIRPALIKENGRRFYSLNQMRILEILCLGKDLGIPPGRAKDALRAGDSAAEATGAKAAGTQEKNHFSSDVSDAGPAAGNTLSGYLRLIGEQKKEIGGQRKRLDELEKRIDAEYSLLTAAEIYRTDPKTPERKTADVTVYFPEILTEDLLPLLGSAELWTSLPAAGTVQSEAEGTRTGISFSDPDAERQAKSYLRDAEKSGFHGTFPCFSFRGTKKELLTFSMRTADARPGLSVWIRHLFTLCRETDETEYFAEIYLV